MHEQIDIAALARLFCPCEFVAISYRGGEPPRAETEWQLKQSLVGATFTEALAAALEGESLESGVTKEESSQKK